MLIHLDWHPMMIVFLLEPISHKGTLPVQWERDQNSVWQLVYSCSSKENSKLWVFYINTTQKYISSIYIKFKEQNGWSRDGWALLLFYRWFLVGVVLFLTRICHISSFFFYHGAIYASVPSFYTTFIGLFCSNKSIDV